MLKKSFVLIMISLKLLLTNSYHKNNFNKKNYKCSLSDLTVNFYENPMVSRSCIPSVYDHDAMPTSSKQRKIVDLIDRYSEHRIRDLYLYSLRRNDKIKFSNQISQLINESTAESENGIDPNIVILTLNKTLAVIEYAKPSKFQYQIIRTYI